MTTSVRKAAPRRRIPSYCEFATHRQPRRVAQWLIELEAPIDLTRLLAAKHPIHAASRIAQVALTSDGRWLSSNGWRFDELPENAGALFSCLPAVNKAEVAAAVGATNAAEGASGLSEPP